MGAAPRRGVRRPHAPPALLLVIALVATACSKVVTLDAPDIGDERRVAPAQSYVYDADGNQLAVLRHEFRERVRLEDIPQVMLDAIVVAEDRRFWSHAGVDARAIARAAVRNAAEGRVTQGGSTITQQLVKNLYMQGEPRTLETKAREALLAVDLEREMSKEQILEEYLNTVYFGNGAYGVQAAAYTYFRRDIAEVDLAEAALLAGVVRAPTSLDPVRARERAQRRRDVVLRGMEEEGLASHADVVAAMATEVDVEQRPPTPSTEEPHWVDFVVRTMLDDATFGEDEADRAALLYGGGLRIHTTLRPQRQAEARAAALEFFPDVDDPEVAVVAVEPGTGEIVAAVGGRDYAQRQFDLATQGRRQPGSTFKTFVLAAAVEAGYRPDSIVDGDQGTLIYGDGHEWPVHNYDLQSYGDITLDEATRSSVNAAYARLILDVGVGRTIETAHALGIESALNLDPAIALGALTRGVSPLEMAQAYATLANMGRRVPASPIDRIEDADGNVIWRPDRTPQQVLDAGVAFLVTQMLIGVVEDGTGVHARLPLWQAAGKTGTTQDYTDAWFVGYTPTLATSVWMGYPEGRIELRDVNGESVVTGGSWPARIWREFMVDALEGVAPRDFELPPDQVVTVLIDPETDLLAAPWCPGVPRTMPRLLVPTETCPPPPPPPPSPTVTEEEPTAPTSPSEPCPSPRPTSGRPNRPRRECPTASASPSPTATGTGEPSPSPQPSSEPSPSESAPSEPEPTPSPTGSASAPAPSPSADGV